MPIVISRMQNHLKESVALEMQSKKLSSDQFLRFFQALNIALYKGHPHVINLRSTDSTVGGARASKYNISIF